MSAQNLTGTDRTLLNVAIVAALITIGVGVTFLATGWGVAKAALLVAGPVAIIAISVALIRSWWPRDDV